MSAGRFSGKSVLVTGASAGIGAAAARQFSAEGAAVALVARKPEPLEELAASIRDAGGSAVAIPGDVCDRSAAASLVERAVEAHGGLDVLVNNAGANRRGAIEQYAPEELAGVIDVNLVAPIMLTRLALPHLRKRRGAVVNVASIAGQIPVGHEAVYSATKFGLRAFTLALTEELEGSGVSASVVSPGPVETGFILEDLDSVPDLVFAQPMSSADEVAALILDCAADGRPERTIPRLTGILATAGYLAPGIRKLLFPMMERQGKAAKEVFRKKYAKE